MSKYSDSWLFKVINGWLLGLVNQSVSGKRMPGMSFSRSLYGALSWQTTLFRSWFIHGNLSVELYNPVIFSHFRTSRMRLTSLRKIWCEPSSLWLLERLPSESLWKSPRQRKLVMICEIQSHIEHGSMNYASNSDWTQSLWTIQLWFLVICWVFETFLMHFEWKRSILVMNSS